MSRRITHTEAWWQRMMSRAVAKINFNTIFMTFIAGAFATWQMIISGEHTEDDKKKEKIAKVDSSWKEKANQRWDSLFTILKHKR